MNNNSKSILEKSSSIIVDAYASLPKKLDTALVRSAAEYRILLHLVRPLLKYNSKAQLEADLATSWKIEEDFSKYIFKIDPEAKWSNGSQISSEQIAKSIHRQIRLNNATHFDFSKIKYVRFESDVLIIKLENRNPHFLKSVAHPEFAAVYDAGIDALALSDYQITSGPYFLDTYSPNFYVLKRNQLYLSVNRLAPDTIKFQSSPFAEQMHLLETGLVDFIVPSAGVTEESHTRLKTNPQIKVITPHVGYSYWFSLNPKSQLFENSTQRKWFQNLIHKTKLDFSNLSTFWIRADQIYLPDGFGRPSPEQITKMWHHIDDTASKNAPGKLRLAVSKSFPWTEQIVNELKSQNVVVRLIFYSTAAEFEQISGAGNFDAILVNNDFSDSHLVENLLVTFSDSRPLVFTGSDRTLQAKLSKATRSADMDESIKLSIEIGLDLLSKGLVAPIAYNRKSFYARSNLDLSEWSELQSDLCFWKVAVKKK